jgi:hypothetical protein
MARQRINEGAAMTPLERRQKSDTDRLARGEHRLTCWLTAEGNASLIYLLKMRDFAGVQRGDKTVAVSAALEYLAKANGMDDEDMMNILKAIPRTRLPKEPELSPERTAIVERRKQRRETAKGIMPDPNKPWKK